MEAKGLKEEQEAGHSQGPGPGPGSTSATGHLPPTPGSLVHTSSDTDEELNKDGENEDQPQDDGEEVKLSLAYFLNHDIYDTLLNCLFKIIVRKRRKMMKMTMMMRVQRTKLTEKRKIIPNFLRWAQSCIGMGHSHRSSLLYPLRHRPSHSLLRRLYRLPSFLFNPYQTTTLQTTQEVPAQSCRGYWWGNRGNSWLRWVQEWYLSKLQMGLW